MSECNSLSKRKIVYWAWWIENVDTNLDIIHKLIQSTWLLLRFMTIRIVLLWWVGCISLILVTILPSCTALCRPWPSTPIPTTTDLIYTKLTPHLLLHNLSHSIQPCTPSPKNLLYLIWLNQFWNSYGILISRKALTVKQSKPSPKTCVICHEKAPVSELTKPTDVEWYLLSHGHQFQWQLN